MRLRALAAGFAALVLAVTVAPVAAQGAPDTLTVTRLSDFPTCFHPICFQTGNQYMNFQLLFNSLVKVDTDESTFIPDLADSWEVSPDATTFTFKLNPDAVWHDGTPVTADDVIYTAATAAQMADTYTTNGTYPIADWTSVLGADKVVGTTDIPEGLKKIDDHTVQFTLAAPNAVWLRNLADPAYMIMPKHILDGLDAEALQASDFANGKGTIGSGPYKLTNFTPDVAVEYAANDAYFKGAPKIPKVIFKLGVDPATAAAQIQSGELDMAIEMSPGDYDVLKGVDGVDVVNVPGLGVQFLQFPVTNPQVADKRIRQAIYYAFDRKTLLETAFQGAGELLWGPGGFDLSDPSLNHYEFNQDKAKELIAAAVADGAFDASKPLRVIYYPEEPGWPEISAALQNDLTAVGLNVELDPSDAAGWEAKLSDATAYEISLQCCGSFYHPDRNAGAYNCETPVGTFYANCDIDKLFKAARETGDPAEQSADYLKIAQILNEDVPYNWLWYKANTNANTAALSDFAYYPNARESFAQIEKWTLTR
ncbi:MAG: ABC transporter substrate-binding protein [Chloroflexota bacterium]